MSRAMKFYMERRREYDEFIEKERFDFDLGKKHLANMMGKLWPAGLKVNSCAFYFTFTLIFF